MKIYLEQTGSDMVIKTSERQITIVLVSSCV